MYEFLKSVEITNDTFPTLMEQCGSSISFLTTGGQKVFKSGGYIQKFVDAMKVTVFCVHNIYSSLLDKLIWRIIGP